MSQHDPKINLCDILGSGRVVEPIDPGLSSKQIDLRDNFLVWATRHIGKFSINPTALTELEDIIKRSNQ